MLLSDGEIIDLSLLKDPPMIEPFVNYGEAQMVGVISYGVCSAGYDLRLAGEILFFRHGQGGGGPVAIDPKRFKDSGYQQEIFGYDPAHPSRLFGPGDPVTIPPNSYVLGRSYEYLRIPRWLKARCVGKSTYARSGILINTTPLEPEWEGHLTIEIGNVTPHYAVIYVMEGIAQLEFEVLSREPLLSYKDKGGKYQGQTGVTPARVL